MFKSYLLINSEQEELIKYESIKLEVFRYTVLFLTFIGSIRIFTWLKYFSYKIYLLYFNAKSKIRDRDKSTQPIVNQTKLRRKTAKKNFGNLAKKLLASNGSEAETEESEQPMRQQVLTRSRAAKNEKKTSESQGAVQQTDCNSSPGSASIAGVAAAAATAATVFMDKRREKRKCCGKCCANKSL
jgi:hypothetical protein